MKRLILLLTAIVLVLNISSCGKNKTKPIINTLPDTVQENKETLSDNKLTRYDMKVDLDETGKLLTGEANISYFNSEGVALDSLYFHIYPNAYKRKETSPVPPEDFDVVYTKGFKPGSIDIRGVNSNSTSLPYSIEGADETILKIILDKPLMPNDRFEVSINFEITLPPAHDRLGYGEDSYNFGNWYPVAAVYDSTGWNLDPYYAIGDPFYSDVSDYKVNITVPENMLVAATGETVDEKATGGRRTYTFKEESIRDFAWAASDKFRVDVEEVDGIQIKNYYLDGSSDRNEFAMNVAKASIKLFNKTYGKYPYSTFSIVATHFITGMEYPGIVFINKDYYYDYTDLMYLEATIAHEAAHQWWYGTVGNDEIDEAWVDESLAAYSEVVYFENTISSAYGKSYMENEYTEVYNDFKMNASGDDRILKPVYEFQNLNEYAIQVYYKGAMMHDAIRREVGDEVFFKILQTYYKEYKFKNASSEDYIDIVEKVTGKEWDDFFNKWL